MRPLVWWNNVAMLPSKSKWGESPTCVVCVGCAASTGSFRMVDDSPSPDANHIIWDHTNVISRIIMHRQLYGIHRHMLGLWVMLSSVWIKNINRQPLYNFVPILILWELSNLKMCYYKDIIKILKNKIKYLRFQGYYWSRHFHTKSVGVGQTIESVQSPNHPSNSE
jgi:hypothetical protein